MKGKYWDKAWSLVEGCTPVSEACNNCWLASMAHRFKTTCIKETTIAITSDHFPMELRLTTFNGKFNGTVNVRPDRLDIPLKTKKPTVFAVWSDLFHADVPKEFILKAFDRMDQASQHIFLVLTKRPLELYEFCSRYGIGSGNNFPDNAWLGVTAENQEQADKRIPILLQVPAAKRFVSIEPMLSGIDFTNIGTVIEHGEFEEPEYLHGLADLDLVILGGESGHKARPMHPDWVRSVRDQCQAAGVPFFFKQWGTYKGPGDWKIPAGRLLDGREWNDLPWRLK
ncbi:MAG: phage Gp37/Gp68 family protein [Candidatus Marinimicrobia bacterium]|nr:phage Gp37/Gp68 family protein [Candidatus Neomarinimicrobiota bacterium]